MQDNKYTLEEFFELTKKVGHYRTWNPEHDKCLHQVEGWLRTKLPDDTKFSIRTILLAVRHIAGKPVDVWYENELQDRVAYWESKISKYKEQQMQANKIETNKKYRRVGTHEPVRVICVDRITEDDRIPVVALLKHADGIEESLCLSATGCSFDGVQIIEEIPAVDWSKVEVDTPMWVKFPIAGVWHRRHFHRFDGKRVHFWPNGYTSFTADTTTEGNSKLPEDCSLEEPK